MPTTSPTSGASILRNKRVKPELHPRHVCLSTIGFARACYDNKPYDQFVRDILAASGEMGENPPVAWYRAVKDAEPAGRRHGPALPGLADSMCPLPSSSVRELEPARLLRLRGVLLAGGPQERLMQVARSSGFSTTAGQAPAVNPRTGEAVEAGRARRAAARSDARSRSAASAGRLDGRPKNPFFARPWSTAIGSTSSAAAWSSRKTTCG